MLTRTRARPRRTVAVHLTLVGLYQCGSSQSPAGHPACPWSERAQRWIWTQAELLEECLEFQQFLRSHPFPSREICIRQLSEHCHPQYASLLSSEVYAISRGIYETFDPFKDGLNVKPISASIIAAGEWLYALGGQAAMTAVYYVLNGRHRGFSALRHLWDGVGSWQA